MRAALLLAVCSLSASALADTDYRCLNQCMNNGDASSICLPRCAYALPDTAKKMPADSSAHLPQNHRSVATPLNATSQVIIKPETKSRPQPEQDYPCLQACLQDHKQYDYCTSSCAVKK